MKTMTINRETKNTPAKKHSNINYDAALKINDGKSAQKDKFDLNSISEGDLDRIMACS